MQIHELNNRKKQDKEQVQEALSDFVPQELVQLKNLGKQVMTNPSALLTNRGMAQASQAAAQQTATGPAAKLAKQGFTTAAAPKTSTEILPQVKANPATQQMIKTIAAEWQKQAAALSGQPVKESVVNELAPAQAAYKAPTTAYAQRPTGYAQTTTNAPVANTPQATSTPAVQQKLQAQQVQQSQAKILQQFTAWANTKLTALTVDPDVISRDPNVSSTMKALANKIAANPVNSANDVIEYFNLAIAANIADNRARRAGFYQPQAGAQGQTTATGATGQAPATPADIVKQAGLAPQLIQGLGAALVKADKGSMSMKRTGNPLADAMFQQMGFKLAP
jgi:hypothetical protein